MNTRSIAEEEKKFRDMEGVCNNGLSGIHQESGFQRRLKRIRTSAVYIFSTTAKGYQPTHKRLPLLLDREVLP